MSVSEAEPELETFLRPGDCGLCGGPPDEVMTLSWRSTGGLLWAHRSCYEDAQASGELRITGETRVLRFLPFPPPLGSLSEPARDCYFAVGRLIRGDLPPVDQIDGHAVLSAARVSWLLLMVANRAAADDDWLATYRTRIWECEALLDVEMEAITSGTASTSMCWGISQEQPSRGECVPSLCAMHGPADVASWAHVAELARWLMRQRPFDVTPQRLGAICQELWHADYRYTITHELTPLILDDTDQLGTWATAFDEIAAA